MCGIVGLFGRLERAQVDIAVSMSHAIAHRGPDGEEVVALDAAAAGWNVRHHAKGGGADIVLGHRRLSIIDLSENARQPMGAPDEKLWLTFNGEIYNYMEIRAELETLGVRFRSTSDTEVVLRGYERLGTDIFARLDGMFALAIADLRSPGEPEIVLARDRFGVKPLLYAEHEGVLRFASEMKALLADPDLPRRILPASVDAYLTYLYVPEPATILEGVRKLLPGHWMRVTRSSISTTAYWSAPRPEASRETERVLVDRFRRAFREAVSRQTIADVPVGAFLSGGLDSTAIVTAMTESGHPPVRVYSTGFSAEESRMEGFSDDLQFAREVASSLRLPQDEILMDPSIVKLLPDLVRAADEPYADPAVFPLYLMCSRARGTTKVLLSGMGGDEILGGYRRHQIARVARHYLAMPSVIRKMARAAADRLPSGSGRFAPTFRRVKRIARGLSPQDAHTGLSGWTTSEERASLYTERFGAAVSGAPPPGPPSRAGNGSFLRSVLETDATVYLPGHNLAYTDRISMAASVEVRVPFLDNALFDLSATLPDDLLVRRGETKRVLRLAFADAMPMSVLTRSKAGLGAPIRSWLLGDLRDLVEKTLSDEKLARRGILAPGRVKELLGDLESKRDDTSYLLWALLTLELWMDIYDVTEVAQ